MSPKAEACCSFMAILKEPDGSQCNISLHGGKLVSCDDFGDRLPPINYCPWCGIKIERKADAT